MNLEDLVVFGSLFSSVDRHRENHGSRIPKTNSLHLKKCHPPNNMRLPTRNFSCPPTLNPFRECMSCCHKFRSGQLDVHVLRPTSRRVFVVCFWFFVIFFSMDIPSLSFPSHPNSSKYSIWWVGFWNP